jgi:hypothetical protein
VSAGVAGGAVWAAAAVASAKSAAAVRAMNRVISSSLFPAISLAVHRL